MKLIDWETTLKTCKRSYSESADQDIKVFRDSSKNIWILTDNKNYKPCKTCGHIPDTKNQRLVIQFDKKHDSLTIFEAGLLFMVYLKHLIPNDYCDYPECVAGKQFIENIKEVRIE